MCTLVPEDGRTKPKHVAVFHVSVTGCKAIPVRSGQAPEGSRRLLLPDITTIGTGRLSRGQPHVPAAFTGNILKLL